MALRELALRETAHELEHRVIAETGPDAGAGPEGTIKLHKILVLATADPQTAMLIRRARRMSAFLQAECFVVAVQPSGDLSSLPDPDREAIERHLNFARNMRIETRILEGEDIAQALIAFARRNQITQVYLARPCSRPRGPWLSRNLVQKVVALARDMQIVIVSERDPVPQGSC